MSASPAPALPPSLTRLRAPPFGLPEGGVGRFSRHHILPVNESREVGGGQRGLLVKNYHVTNNPLV